MNITHLLSTSSLNNYFNTSYLYHEESKLDHIVNLISYDKNLTGKRININDNFYVNYIDGKILCNNILFKNNPIIYNLKHYVNMFNTDIIHTHILFKLTTFSSALISRKLNIPLIITIHGVIAPEGFPLEVTQRIYYYTFGKLICKIASRIRCLTTKDALQMIRFGCPPEKIVVIPNGVDTKKFKPEGESLENIIYWGGRFVPQKGLVYLLKAMKFLKKEKFDVRLIMSGDGPLFSEIYKFVRTNDLNKNVIFIGRVPFNEIPGLLNSATICVLPSIMEGMPYALLEAMSCGRPVIASDIPGITDVITNGYNGILIPPRDPIELANTIMRLIDDGDTRMKLGKNARQLMVEKFNWNIIAEKMEKIYYDVFEKS